MQARGWTAPYFVDADHIGLKTVDAFLESSDFFTLDVADWIGVDAGASAVDAFRRPARAVWSAGCRFPGMDRPLEISRPMIAEAAQKFLAAVGEAGRIYRRIAERQGRPAAGDRGVDGRDRSAADAGGTAASSWPRWPTEGIPAQTIAPRFIGRFNKGVDYVGDVAEFRRQFEEDLAVVALAVKEFRLAGEPEAERAFRQRQVRHLPADARGA